MIVFNFLGVEFITYKSVAGILQINLSHTLIHIYAFKLITHTHTYIHRHTQYFQISLGTLIKYQTIGYFVPQSKVSKSPLLGEEAYKP